MITSTIHSLLRDSRYAMRMMARSPGFTFVALLSIAIGVAANTSIFSVVYSVLLRPLPFAEPSRLVSVDGGYHLINSSSDLPSDFLVTKTATTSFDSLAVYDSSGSVTLAEGGLPERILTTRVSTNFFSVLGVNPSAGRNFLEEDGKVGSNRVVVLSQQIWRRRFNSNHEMIGANIRLNGESFTVVGVMPDGFEFPQYWGKAEMWVPLIWNDKLMSAEGEFFDVIGRLRRGVQLEGAQREMDTITRRIQVVSDYKVDPIRLTPLAKQFSKEIAPALWILLGAVGFVLLIGCANVAGLLLGRASSRQKEMAIRSAVGANRKRLISQLLTESLLLALLGGGIGAFLSWLTLDVLVSISPVQIPQFYAIQISRSVLMFTLAVSLVTSLLFGLLPALQFSKPDLNDSLKLGGQKSRPAHASRLRQVLIISEIAIALVLLVGATLMLKTFRNLMLVPKGFETSGLLTFEIAPPKAKYKDVTQKVNYYEKTIASITDAPGVLAVGAANHIPLASKQGRLILPISVAGKTDSNSSAASGDYRVVSPDYFRTLGIALLRGRYFTVQDTQMSPPVMILNVRLARMLFDDEHPIGQRVQLGRNKVKTYEIVGVVADTRNWGLTHEPATEFYINYQQANAPFLRFAVQTQGEPSQLIANIKSAVWSVDSDQSLYDVITMDQALAQSISKQRFSMFMLVIFALMAFGLAMVGIYGLIAFSVTQRTHEIGVRLALGANGRQVVKMIVRQGIILILIGVMLGWAGAFALTRMLATLLYDVKPLDPIVFCVTGLLLGLVGLAACYIPARRAAKTDPLVALRFE